MIKAFKYRLYPTKKQIAFIDHNIQCCSYVFNWALSKRIEGYRKTGKYISRYELQKELTLLKKSETAIALNDAIAQSLQYELINLDVAYKKYLNHNGGFPKFKSGTNKKRSFAIPQGIKVFFPLNRIVVPKIGEVKSKISRYFSGCIKTSTISVNATGKYFISIWVEDGEQEVLLTPFNSSSIGIAFGEVPIITCSDGRTFNKPEQLDNSYVKVAWLKRRLKKKVANSKNQFKMQQRLNKAYERICNIRNDFFYKTVNQIVTQGIDAIFVEDTSSSKFDDDQFVKVSCLSPGINTFKQILKHKCKQNGIHFVKISNYKVSVKLCKCGYRMNMQKMSEKLWVCPRCGTLHNRNLIAANDIKLIGMLQYSGGVPTEVPVEYSVRGSMEKQESVLVNRKYD